MKKRGPSLILLIVVALIVIFIARSRREKRREGDIELNRSEARLIYTKHARCRMNCRMIDETEVKEILEKGKINYSKSEPNDKPDPKYALEGITHDGQSVRIIFAPSKRGVVVITVIDLEREWQCNCN